MKTTAAVLGGAALVASGAYALGSQAGDGSAEAARTRSAAQPYGDGPPLGRPADHRFDGLGTLAQKLGVTTAKLQSAFDGLRTARSKQDDEPAETAALADALGLDAAKVRAALAKLRQQNEAGRAESETAFYAAVAKDLGKTAAEVQKAFEAAQPAGNDGDDGSRADRPDGDGPNGDAPNGDQPDGESPDGEGPDGEGPDGEGPGRHGDADRDTALPAVAKDLGVSAAKLRAAIDAARPSEKGEREDRGAGLADALGVSQAKLDAAFKKLEAQRRDELAASLAQKLGLDKAKVADALASVPFGRGPGGPGGRHR